MFVFNSVGMLFQPVMAGLSGDNDIPPAQIIGNNFYLIQEVVQAFIQIFQIKENYGPSCFHADLDLADITADLHKNRKTKKKQSKNW